MGAWDTDADMRSSTLESGSNMFVTRQSHAHAKVHPMHTRGPLCMPQLTKRFSAQGHTRSPAAPKLRAMAAPQPLEQRRVLRWSQQIDAVRAPDCGMEGVAKSTVKAGHGREEPPHRTGPAGQDCPADVTTQILWVKGTPPPKEEEPQPAPEDIESYPASWIADTGALNSQKTAA